MKDFIGNDFTVGGFVASSGRGNGAGEYGSILYKVLEIDKDKKKLKLLRLIWSNRSNKKPTHTFVTDCIYRFIVVNPSQGAIDFFNDVCNTDTIDNLDNLKKLEYNLMHWIHGKTIMKWSK